MLKIPEPAKTTSLKVKLSAATKKELDIFVDYIRAKQPHANADVVVEAIINKMIPRAGSEAKAFSAFKKTWLEKKQKSSES